MATGQSRKTQDVSLVLIHVLPRKLRLMATGQSKKNQDVSLLLHVLTRSIRLMATGQSRKTQDGSLVFTSCNTSTSSDQDDSLTFTCFTREYRLMATGQSRKNPGCRLHGYGEVSEQFRKIVAGAILQRTCAHNCHSKFAPLWGVCVCVYTLLAQGMVNCACSYKNMQGDGEDV